MGYLILLVCLVPALAMGLIAAVHGHRKGSFTILSILVVSFGLLVGPVLLALAQKDEPPPRVSFGTGGSDMAGSRSTIDVRADDNAADERDPVATGSVAPARAP